MYHETFIKVNFPTSLFQRFPQCVLPKDLSPRSFFDVYFFACSCEYFVGGQFSNYFHL